MNSNEIMADEEVRYINAPEDENGPVEESHIYINLHRRGTPSDAIVCEEDESGEDEDGYVKIEDLGDDLLYEYEKNRGVHKNEPRERSSAPSLKTIDERAKQWERNYSDASVLLQEGKNNEKFHTHPRSRTKHNAYVFAHNLAMNILELVAATVLLLLVVFEPPAVLQTPVIVHACVEILCLLILSMHLVVKLVWLGPRNYVRHISTMIRTICICIVFVEALVILIRQTNHFRITRVIRPIFIVHSPYMKGERRFMRQILQCLRDLAEMLLVMTLVVIIFSILGYFLFRQIPGNTHFSTIYHSIFSLLALITTVNFPDVMLPSYNYNPLSAMFFIVYLIVMVYFLMNLLLAIIYRSFDLKEKRKTKALFIHRRRACEQAMKLLVSAEVTNSIKLSRFQGLMRYYKPLLGRLQVYRLFKCLNTSGSGLLTLEEFYDFFHFSKMKWREKYQKLEKDGPYWMKFSPNIQKFFFVHYFVKSKWFSYMMYGITAINLILFLMDSIYTSVRPLIPSNVFWFAIAFLMIYSLEVVLKMVALGPCNYFKSRWNVYDFVWLLATYIAVIFSALTVYTGLAVIIALRAVKLISIMNISRRYREISDNFSFLLPRAISAGSAIFLFYYSYAIIGMELFYADDLKNCCENTSLFEYYQFLPENSPSNGGNFAATGAGYYLLNFKNIFSSLLLLFQLSINNWDITMAAYAIVYTDLSRIYFFMFFIVSTLFTSIVVAFIIEIFIFKVTFRDLKKKSNGTEMNDNEFCYDVFLSHDEVKMCNNKRQKLEPMYSVGTAPAMDSSEEGGVDNAGYVGETGDDQGNQPDGNRGVWYQGRRMRKKFDDSLLIYAEDLTTWIEEADLEEERKQTEMIVEQRGPDESSDPDNTRGQEPQLSQSEKEDNHA